MQGGPGHAHGAFRRRFELSPHICFRHSRSSARNRLYSTRTQHKALHCLESGFASHLLSLRCCSARLASSKALTIMLPGLKQSTRALRAPARQAFLPVRSHARFASSSPAAITSPTSPSSSDFKPFSAIPPDPATAGTQSAASKVFSFAGTILAIACGVALSNNVFPGPVRDSPSIHHSRMLRPTRAANDTAGSESYPTQFDWPTRHADKESRVYQISGLSEDVGKLQDRVNELSATLEALQQGKRS